MLGLSNEWYRFRSRFFTCTFARFTPAFVRADDVIDAPVYSSWLDSLLLLSLSLVTRDGDSEPECDSESDGELSDADESLGGGSFARLRRLNLIGVMRFCAV